MSNRVDPLTSEVETDSGWTPLCDCGHFCRVGWENGDYDNETEHLMCCCCLAYPPCDDCQRRRSRKRQ